jgi:hypothetical protein
MLKIKFHIRKPCHLMLLAMLAGFLALMSTSAAAAETFFSKPELNDFMDGDVTVARMGKRGPAVHMSFVSPADVRHGETVNASAVRQAAVTPEVYLSVRLPW